MNEDEPGRRTRHRITSQRTYNTQVYYCTEYAPILHNNSQRSVMDKRPLNALVLPRVLCSATHCHYPCPFQLAMVTPHCGSRCCILGDLRTTWALTRDGFSVSDMATRRDPLAIEVSCPVAYEVEGRQETAVIQYVPQPRLRAAMTRSRQQAFFSRRYSTSSLVTPVALNSHAIPRYQTPRVQKGAALRDGDKHASVLLRSFRSTCPHLPKCQDMVSTCSIVCTRKGIGCRAGCRD